MNKLQYLVGVLLCIGLAQYTHAQEIMQVDPYTGSLNGAIPLVTVSSKTLSYPVTASYHTNGQKVEEGSGNMGVGWDLSVDPMITRVVKGLPDDLLDTGGQKRFGWLHGGGQKVKNFIDAPGISCNNTLATNNTLDSFGGFNKTKDIYDLEPDIYYVNVPGHLSFSFVFNEDGNPTIKGAAMPYEIIHDLVDDRFVIIGPGRIQYVFDHQIFGSTKFEVGSDEGFYFKRFYYNNQENTFFTRGWGITQIATPSCESLDFGYEEFTLSYNDPWAPGSRVPANSKDTLRAYSFNSSLGLYSSAYNLKVDRGYPPSAELVRITSDETSLVIHRGDKLLQQGNYEIDASQIDAIELFDNETEEVISGYDFNYSTIENNEESGTHSHLYLEGITKSTQLRNQRIYSFTYYGVDFEEGSSLFTNRRTLDRDEFGFFAKKDSDKGLRKIYTYPDLPEPFQYRTQPIAGYTGTEIVLDGYTTEAPDIRLIQTGSLKQLKNISGGSQVIRYELNDFYDSIGSISRYGGGIRVKQLLRHDGVDHTKNLIKKYTYENGSNESSGKLIYQPTLAVQAPIFYDDADGTTHYYDELLDQGLTQSAIWSRMTLRFREDLYKEFDPGYNVAYSQFSEEVTGLGKRVYEFNIPYYHGSNEMTRHSRNPLNRSLQSSMGTNESCTVYNTDDFLNLFYQPQAFDYQWNGDLKSMTSLDAVGNTVSIQDNIYSVFGSGSKVQGLQVNKFLQRINLNSSKSEVDAYFFSKYDLLTEKNNLLTQTIIKTYDPLGNEMTSTTDYLYDNDLRLSKETRKLHDGSVYASHFQYANDYTISIANRDAFSDALFYMNSWNMGNIPIETYQTYLDGMQEKVTSGQLSIWKYDDDQASKLGTHQTWSFSSKDGLSNFQPSSVSNFVPPSGGGTTANFEKDNRYELDAEIVERTTDNLTSSTLTRGVLKSGVHIDIDGKTKATFQGAFAKESLFSDFEPSVSEYQWGSTNNPTAAGRLESTAYNMLTSESLTGSVSNGDADYKISLWYKASGAGTVTISVSDGAATVNSTISLSTTTDWTYKEVLVTTSTLSGNTLDLAINSNVTVTLDDVAAYPEHATISYFLYGTGNMLLAQTNTKGLTATTNYDDHWRPKMSKDYEGDITQHLTYNEHAISPLLFSSYSVFVQDAVENKTAKFRANRNIPGAQYYWKVLTESEFDADPDDMSGAVNTNSNEWSTTTLAPNNSNNSYYVVNSRLEYGGETFLATRKFIVGMTPLEVEFCINKPIHIDLCNDDQVVDDCMPASPGDALRINTNVSGGSGTYTYSWLQNREPMQGANSSYIIPSLYYGQSFTVFVTDDAGRTGSVNITFTTYKSDPNCSTNQN